MKKLAPPGRSPSWTEHPLVQAVAGEIPVVRPLTTYWVETVRSRREDDLYLFLAEVARQIDELRTQTNSQLDLDHVTGGDFAETLCNVTEVAVRQQDDSRRKYLQRFIVNYSKVQRPDTNLRNVFFQFASELTGTHLVILDEVYAAQHSLSDADLSVLGEQPDRSEALSINTMAQRLRLDADLVSVLTAMLEARGMLDIKPVASSVPDKTPTLIMRPLARRFMAFLQP